MLKVIFDTHVIVSAALFEKSLPALVLSLGLEEKVRFFVFPALLNEYETVLKRPRFKLEHQETADLIEKIKRKAVMVTPTRELEILKEDETDNRSLECAAKAKVDFVITGNKKHFPFEDFKGTKIVTPREFINHLSEL
jgi:putative PIN family toxin of toxin-antitoxin system